MFLGKKNLCLIIISLVTLFSSCESSQTKENIKFDELQDEERLQIAAQKKAFQEKIYRRTIYDFIHFMNNNQKKWKFRLNKIITIGIADKNHFSVKDMGKKPYSSYVSIWTLFAKNISDNIDIDLVVHGFADIDTLKYGWYSFILGNAWSGIVKGEKVDFFSEKEKFIEITDFNKHLNSALNAFHDTYFNRNDFYNESIEDNMLYNPIFSN